MDNFDFDVNNYSIVDIETFLKLKKKSPILEILYFYLACEIKLSRCSTVLVILETLNSLFSVSAS